ncbi:MAG: GNAT family N-acetyltransferase [Pseudomonadota bacterium]
MSYPYRIVPAGREHAEQMIALLPLLATFELPPWRQPEELWHGDREMVEAWARGERPECFARLALGGENKVVGFAFVSMREELLSHMPSAHLEVLVVDDPARRSGLGSDLTHAVEAEAASRGAHSITLHVFGRNARARALYAKLGYDEELLRCTKALG